MSLTVEITKFICIILITQLLIFAFILFKRKSGNKNSNRFLALLFIAIAFTLTDRIIFFYTRSNLNGALGPIFLFDTFQLTVLPLLFLYTLSFTRQKFKKPILHFLHFIPFFYCFFDVLINYTFLPIQDKRELLFQVSPPLFFVSKNIISQIIGIIKEAQLIYLLISIYFLLKFRKKLREQFSSVSEIKKHSQTWLLVAFALYFVIHVSGLVFNQVFSGFQSYFPFITILNIGYGSVFLYFGLTSPHKFLGFQFDNLLQKQIQGKGYSKAEILAISSFVEKERPFLNPLYSIDNLADDVNISSRKLSTILNKEFGKHFFDFINEYRINYACEILQNELHKNVLEIAFESGFNTKSTFNRVFKKNIQKTPIEYRKSVTL